MIRCLLVDFDGVLRSWAGQDVAGIEDSFGLARGALHRAAFSPDLVMPAVLGLVSDEQWRRNVAARLALQVPLADAERAVALWTEWWGEVDAEVLALVRESRRRGVKVCLLTNGTSRIPEALRQLGLVDELDFVANSSELGVAKPEAGVYEAALKLVGVRAEEALFVDDGLSHVEAAERLGIRAHLFGGAGPLREWLSQAGVVAAVGERTG